MEFIEPSGWRALDYQFARLARRIYLYLPGNKDAPPLEELMTPAPDWRQFSKEGRQELLDEQNSEALDQVMKGFDE